MEKGKSSKKDRLEKLRTSLQSNSGEKLHPEDEKYLKVLQNRLSKNSKEGTVNVYRDSEKTDEKNDSLKPQVTIHYKEAEITETPNFIQPETEKVEVKEEIKDKELFEIKKVEVIGPEFIEVKPKETIKKVETSEKKITQKIEEPEHKEYEKLPEWEPVETKKVEQEQIKEKVEEKHELKDEEIPEFEALDSEDEQVKTVEEKKPLEEKDEPEFEEIKEPFAKEPSDFESSDTESKEFEITEEEKKLEHEEDMFFEEKGERLFCEEKQNKLDAFKDIINIDEKTATLLYDNGFTSLDDLRSASVKDLSRIKGIKRKLAKKIKKELQELEIARASINTTPQEETSESFILEEEFEEEKKEEEFVPEEEFMEDEKMFFDEDKEQTLHTKKDERINVFDGIESIDGKTASLLVENGIISVDVLKETSVKNLAKIDGIGKKLAKKIKKDLKKKSKKAKKTTAFSIAEAYDKDVSKDFEEPSEKIVEEKETITKVKKSKKQKPRVKKKSKQYKHGSYTLYKKDVKTKSKKSKDKQKREVYFFSKQKRNRSEPSDLPKGFEVRINRKTGVPYLRKRK